MTNNLINVFFSAVNSRPQSEVTWYHDDHVITESPKYILHGEDGVHKLEVVGVTGEDEGTYRVHAQNRHGKVVCSCNLHVIGM